MSQDMVFFLSSRMTFFDQLHQNIYKHYRNKKSAYANRIAVWYVTLVQSSLLLLLGIFFAEFFQNMRLETLSSNKAWSLYGLLVIGLYFKNWMQYSGRKRTILKAKSFRASKEDYHILVLWMLPLGCFLLAILLLRVFN